MFYADTEMLGDDYVGKDEIVKYSIQLSMLKQLLQRKLINDDEYQRVLKLLKKESQNCFKAL